MYQGQAFYRKKKEIKKFAMSGRIMINTALFREKNSNYFFPNINEKPFEDNLNDDSNFKNKSSGNNGVIIKRKVFCSPEELLLYNETVYGFCFTIK
jgi:hypothetical protein